MWILFVKRPRSKFDNWTSCIEEIFIEINELVLVSGNELLPCLACGEWMWEEELNVVKQKELYFLFRAFLCLHVPFWLKLIVKLKRKMNNLMVASAVTANKILGIMLFNQHFPHHFKADFYWNIFSYSSLLHLDSRGKQFPFISTINPDPFSLFARRYCWRRSNTTQINHSKWPISFFKFHTYESHHHRCLLRPRSCRHHRRC